MVLGYIRTSTDLQDFEKQRHLILEYAHTHKITIDDFIEVSISSKKDPKTRRVDELLERLGKGDTLIAAELSRLGRNMLEVLNMMDLLSKMGINVIFIRQPELSTNGPLRVFLIAIFGYLAESERDYISMRTKQGLAALKAKGVKLGRPKGSRSESIYFKYKSEILELVNMNITVTNINKMINAKIEKDGGKARSYQSLYNFINTDKDLVKARNNFKGSLLAL